MQHSPVFAFSSFLVFEQFDLSLNQCALCIVTDTFEINLVWKMYSCHFKC